MLTLSTPHLLYPRADTRPRHSGPEQHLLSPWQVHGIPGKAMLNNHFHELPHFPESLFPSGFHYRCQGAIVNLGNALSCDTDKIQYPVIQNQNIFINGPILKALQYKSHSFEQYNITGNDKIHSSVQNSNLLRDQKHRLVSLVSRRLGKTALSLQKMSCSNKSSKMKRVLSKQRAVETSEQNTSSCSSLDINLMIERNRTKLDNAKEESNTRWLHHRTPPGKNKLGHSIASILDISPGNVDCLASEVRIGNKESDNSYCVNDIDDDDSSTTSEVLVDDDDYDDYIVDTSRSDDNQDIVTGINYRPCLTNSSDECSKSDQDADKSCPADKDNARESATSIQLNTHWCRNVNDDIKNDKSTNDVLVMARNSEDCVRKDDAFTSFQESCTLPPQQTGGKTVQSSTRPQETNNTCTTNKISPHSSQMNREIASLLPKDKSFLKMRSTSHVSNSFTSSSSASTVLPPIQTLCQPYHEAATNERSAFKPIRKLASTSQQVPPLHYQSWTARTYLHPSIHQSNQPTHGHLPIMQSSKTHDSRHSRIDPAANKSKEEGIGILRQKSSFYQSQHIPDNFLSSSASLATKLLPNPLETWMSWLRQKDITSVKSNKCEDGASSRASAPPRYHCEACSKTYSTFGGFSKHRQFHCTQHVKKEFVCKVCNRAYSSLGALKMHIRTHTLPCRCQECGKAFSRPWLLQGHLRTHTGEKPFKCNHCGRAFADRSNLRAHLQTHAEIKRYACGKCGKTFSRMSLLTKHVEISCPVNLKK